jgi:uncharacterized protein (DUF302 family)
MRYLIGLLLLTTFASGSYGAIDRVDWRSIDTPLSFANLVKAIEKAAPESGLGVVNKAGPTEAAKKRGVTIPGNCVIGLFNNDAAVNILDLSLAAMIEAPVRMYVTENEDGTATLSWKSPSSIFAPYTEEGGPKLIGIAEELDRKFEAVAAVATKF